MNNFFDWYFELYWFFIFSGARFILTMTGLQVSPLMVLTWMHLFVWGNSHLFFGPGMFCFQSWSPCCHHECCVAVTSSGCCWWLPSGVSASSTMCLWRVPTSRRWASSQSRSGVQPGLGHTPTFSPGWGSSVPVQPCFIRLPPLASVPLCYMILKMCLQLCNQYVHYCC